MPNQSHHVVSGIRRPRLHRLLEFGPATLAYFTFRYILLPSAQPVFWAASTKQFVYDAFVSGVLIGDWIKGGLTFGVLWILALYGWRIVRGERDHPLVRWAPLVPLILVVPFILALNVGRVWIYAFPVVIPLSLIGIHSLWMGGRAYVDPLPNSLSHSSRTRNP